jgi:wyosine [tRNA(Phe)-imidazoG37] synthetase (radical SAM superfamily)
MSSIIFYGAGEYVKENWERLIRENLIPVCFADKDINKQGTLYYDKPVYSLKKAISLYPDYLIYITAAYHYLTDITVFLHGLGIKQERIRYCEDVDFRKSCGEKEKDKSLAFSTIGFCLEHRQINDIKRSDNLSDDFNKLEEYYKTLIKRQKDGENVVCNSCRRAYYGVFRNTHECLRYGIRSDFRDETCNFNCLYCNQKEMLDAIAKIPEDSDSIFELFQKLKPHFDKEKMIIGYAAAELTLSKHRDQILDFISEEGWKMQLSTNASIYNEKIAHLMKIGQIELIVSLDAGTRDTFKKVRGVDLFDKVIHNLEKYRDFSGKKITLQYIIVDNINDNDEDVNSFIEIVKRLNARFICTFDASDLNYREISDKKADTMQKLIDGIKGFTEIKRGNAYNQTMRRPGLLNFEGVTFD